MCWSKCKVLETYFKSAQCDGDGRRQNNGRDVDGKGLGVNLVYFRVDERVSSK
jgi:hypothetical protein